MPKTAITGTLISLAIDKDGAVPIHRQIAEGLREAIALGRLAGGAKLPSTRVFAEELGVSRNTVLQVFDTLKDEGVLSGQVGAGTYVTARRPGPDERGAAAEIASALEAGVAGSVEQDLGHFRSLSRRGRALMVSATAEFGERPTPFMPDMPDLRAFPIRTWLRLLNETSGRLMGQILVEASNAGYEPLRHAIAQHLNAARGLSCTAEQVIVTTGSQQGLDLVCRMLLDAGDPVWIEEPGYVGTRSVVQANGGAIFPTACDSDGLDVDRAFADHPVPRLIVVSPSRQYPLGATMTPERRRRLVEIAQGCGAWILEDDYDNEFLYGQTPPRAVAAIDGQQRTILMGTFSKILLPSFRLGYIVVPPDLSTAFAKARAVVDRHASLIEQMVLSEFMNRGLFASHIRRMRTLYHARRQLTLDSLCAIFDRPFACPDSGTHVVLPFRPGEDDRGISGELAARGLIMRPLSPYYMGREVGSGLLLGYSAFNDDESSRGFRLLEANRRLIAAALAD